MAYVICEIDGYILGIGQNQETSGGISESEYDGIAKLFQNKPKDLEGYIYKLRADNLEWELVKLPPAPEYEPTEADKAEAYDILMGVSE